MVERKYEVWSREGRVASDMDLSTALLLIEAPYRKYYNEPADYQIREIREDTSKETAVLYS